MAVPASYPRRGQDYEDRAVGDRFESVELGRGFAVFWSEGDGEFVSLDQARIALATKLS
mgnify:CR=1 FL=1